LTLRSALCNSTDRVHSYTGRTADAQSGALAAAGDTASGRVSIDIRRFPWIRRLAADYAYDYARVAEFFAGNPAEATAWPAAIARVSGLPRQRQKLVELLQAQQRRRNAPSESMAAAAVLGDPRSVAVVTGQQAGLFGGPLFTLLKAVTTIRLAERVRVEHHVPAVAVFWVDAEDHDWNEVKACGILDAHLGLQSISSGDPQGAGHVPVAKVRLDENITAALSQLEAALPATEFTPGLLEDLRRIYRPGAGMVDAFSQWLERVLGSRGLVVFDSSDPAAKPLAAELFALEVERAGDTSRRAAEAGEALVLRDYHAQVIPQEDGLALFAMNDQREPIRKTGDQFTIGNRTESASDLRERVRRAPEGFSPNVLLRPLVQDTLFPTVCYVAGPNELAYLAQLRQVYEAFSVPMPLVQQRSTATIVDGNAMRFLSRPDVRFESLRAQDEAALNELLVMLLPPSIDASIDEARAALEHRMEDVTREATKVDATLEGASRSTLGRMQDDLKKLQAKIVQAAKRKDETLRRQFQHAQAQAFPGGQPQERAVGFVYFLNRYGPALVDRLIEALPADMGKHSVITI
jgi:bacillithiol biosynthesis cysteine-adding enzyme BshC